MIFFIIHNEPDKAGANGCRIIYLKSDSIVLLSHGPSAYLVLPLLNRFQKAGYLRLRVDNLREEPTAINFSLWHILNRQVINQRCLVNPGCGLVLDSHIVFLRCFLKVLYNHFYTIFLEVVLDRIS
jgi:hypothetical protein